MIVLDDDDDVYNAIITPVFFSPNITTALRSMLTLHIGILLYSCSGAPRLSNY